jgi:hypothetical protein
VDSFYTSSFFVFFVSQGAGTCYILFLLVLQYLVYWTEYPRQLQEIEIKLFKKGLLRIDRNTSRNFCSR